MSIIRTCDQFEEQTGLKKRGGFVPIPICSKLSSQYLHKDGEQIFVYMKLHSFLMSKLTLLNISLCYDKIILYLKIKLF